MHREAWQAKSVHGVAKNDSTERLSTQQSKSARDRHWRQESVTPRPYLVGSCILGNISIECFLESVVGLRGKKQVHQQLKPGAEVKVMGVQCTECGLGVEEELGERGLEKT